MLLNNKLNREDNSRNEYQQLNRNIRKRISSDRVKGKCEMIKQKRQCKDTCQRGGETGKPDHGEIINCSNLHFEEMNYTKFFRKKSMYSGSSSSPAFTMSFSDEKIKLAMEILKDIKKTKFIIDNYTRVDFQFDIDEYFAYFLRDKNEFINELKDYLENNRNLSPQNRKNITSILEIIKSSMDNLLKDFKLLKQRLFRKMHKAETFKSMKLAFFKKFHNENSKPRSINIITDRISSVSTIIPLQKILSSPFSAPPGKAAVIASNENKQPLSSRPTIASSANEELPDDFDDDMRRYRDNPNIIHMFKEPESKSLDKTKQILFELSELLTTCQKKMHEQTETTHQILINSEKSIENIEKGNKELTKAHEYQKGRGLMYGMIFIILGLFLIFYDYSS